MRRRYCRSRPCSYLAGLSEGYAEQVGGGTQLRGAAAQQLGRAALRTLEKAAVAAEKGLHRVHEDHAEKTAFRGGRRGSGGGRGAGERAKLLDEVGEGLVDAEEALEESAVALLAERAEGVGPGEGREGERGGVLEQLQGSGRERFEGGAEDWR